MQREFTTGPEQYVRCEIVFLGPEALKCLPNVLLLALLRLLPTPTETVVTVRHGHQERLP